MIDEILTAAGVKHRKARFLKPPADTYAVYFDDIEIDSADRVSPPTRAGLPKVENHSARIELYEPKPDDETEQAIEAELNARGIPWTKEDRYWLQDVQRYQVLYEFDFYTKN